MEDLLATRKNIVTTDCVYLDDVGVATDRHCDGNSWAETEASRQYLTKVDPSKPLFLEYGGAHGSTLQLGSLDSAACLARTAGISAGHMYLGRSRSCSAPQV